MEDTASEFIADHKHIYDYAAQKRILGKEDEANMLYYLLNCVVDRCRIIDEQRAKLKKCWKGDKNVN